MRGVTIAVVIFLASAGASTVAAGETCDEGSRRAGLCSTSVSGAIDGAEAILGGEELFPGSTGGGGSGGGTSASPVGDPDAPRFLCKGDDPEIVAICEGTAADPLTLSDIARFRPAPGTQRMEPDGWVVVGLPANIYSLVEPEIVPGQLLGRPADVRFTPVTWHWDYGDGSTASLGTKGATWAALGLREFDATPTSHVYRAAGEYTIRLSIAYRAEYRLAGGGFVPIAGTITLPANELHITAGGAKTVLVDRDCTVAPRGPGC